MEAAIPEPHISPRRHQHQYRLTGLRQNSLVGKQIAAAEYQMSSKQVVSEIMQKTPPKGVFVSLEALAGICTFLMRQFARNITGQSITVDGGCTTR